ncbi:MAG: aminotransferase-like domain-containing protein [Chloroflexota bacterium]
MKTPLSHLVTGVRPSTVSDILKAATRPDIISFAGGLPAMELFPVEELRAAAERVVAVEGAAAFQYGPSAGYAPLRDYLAVVMGRRGITCGPDDIFLTSGSQQAIDLLCRAFLNPGDAVIVETPTYLTAIRVFQAVGAQMVAAPMDEGGIVVERLRELLERYRPKMLYTIPNFQNPTGVTLAAERRQVLAELAASYGVVVIEDDPYGQIRYAGVDLPPVKAYDREGQVVYVGTLSKTVAPGLRVGWAVIEPSLLEPMIAMKQVADTMSSTFDQRVAHAYLSTGTNAAHVAHVREVYRERYQAMDEALHEHMPAGFRWTHPEGGMFLWVTGPDDLNTMDLVSEALARGVLYVPGEDFYPDASGKNTMRLSFSVCDPARIRRGIAILGALCAEKVAVGAGGAR